MRELIESEAREDFNRARKHAFFRKVLNLFSPEKQELLSLQEVREILKPRSETYRGMQQVEIDQIVGSEGRYRDFNNQFLPRHEHLRSRWQSVDMAHLSDVILPPITLYEIGGVYFVRDGNHRVSVAKAQGVKMIDAEVVSLNSEIPLNRSLTRENLRRAVINHERSLFRSRLPIETVLPHANFTVSATGRYEELIQHVYGHKYFLNESEKEEIAVETALGSWHANVYTPIAEAIRSSNLMARFPGRTETDLYLWIVRHWDELKHRYGQDFPVQAAAQNYSELYGKSVRQRVKRLLRRLLHRS